MNSTVSFRKIILAAVVSVASVGISFAGSNTSFNGDRVTVASDKSFEQVTSAVKSLVAKNGLMVMAEVNQGKMLSMAGLSLKATLFVVGNPTVGKQLFEQDHGVGLYVPLRVFVYADSSCKTFVSTIGRRLCWGSSRTKRSAWSPKCWTRSWRVWPIWRPTEVSLCRGAAHATPDLYRRAR